MKLTKFVFLILFVSLLTPLTVIGQKLTLELSEVKMEEAFKAIESASEYYFFYQSDMLDSAKMISLDVKNETIEKILDLILEGTGLGYEITGKHVVISEKKPESGTPGASGPVSVVTGTVTDEDNNPVPGVSILLKGKSYGTITDSEGSYILKVQNPEDILVFSFVGLKSEEIRVADRKVINVQLEQDIMGLEDVVVIGYGVVKKSDLTGSVTSLKVDQIGQTPAPLLGQAIAGRAPGVYVQQTSGRPGEAPTIRIRGGNSINGDNEPLFVIDGFISASGAQNINPEDIQSIEILKDASATAIYGSRGANGVIIVTTKGGKSGEKIEISFKSVIGTQKIIQEYDMLDAAGHIKYLNDYQAYFGLPPKIPDPSAIPYDEDWEDAMFRKGSMQNYYVSASGGSDRARYFGSFDYLNQDGIVINSGFKRYSTRLNLDLDISENIRAGARFSYLQTFTDDVSNVFLDALQVSPTFPIKNEDGSYNYLLSYDSPGLEVENPIETLREYTDLQEKKTVGIQSYIDFRILRDLHFKSELSSYWTNKLNSSYIPSYTLSGMQNLSTANLTDADNMALETVNTLSYERQFKFDHKLGAMIGFSTISENSRSFTARAKDLTEDVLKYYNLSAGDPLQNVVSSNYVELRQLSFLSRINYDIKNKYLVTFSGRYDGSSNFGSNNKYAFFPSGALAWRLSQEDFINNLNVFDNLKLRVSYGLTGNQAIQPYQTYQLLQPGITAIGNQPDLFFNPIRLANPNLKWETTKQFNVGMDFGFFKNRLYFNMDYYHKLTNDLLLAKAIPSTTGFSTLIDNIGEIENKGFEMEAKAFLVEKNNFSWNMGLAFSLNRNKILDLGESDFIFPDDSRVTNAKTDNTNILMVGEPVGAFYTYLYDGIFQTVEEISDNPSLSGTMPGGMKIKDQDDNGIITEADKRITGYAQPDFIFGINSEFTFLRNFIFTMFWQGSVGGEILNYNNYLFTINQSNIPANMQDYWTPDNKDAVYPSPGFSGQVTDNYIEDGSYIRLKNIVLNYNLPADFLRKVKISSASVFISAFDILTFTRYSGINPEVNFFGSSNTVLNADFNSYPTAKSVNAGVKINF